MSKQDDAETWGVFLALREAEIEPLDDVLVLTGKFEPPTTRGAR